MDTEGQVEQALLSAMLQDFDQHEVHNAFSVLSADDFEYTGHAQIYLGIKTLVEQGDRVSLISLHSHLKTQPTNVVDMNYLSRLMDLGEPVAMIEQYAELLHRDAMLRNIKRAGINIQQASTRFENPEEALVYCQGELIQLSQRSNSRRAFLTADDAMKTMMENLEARIENPTDVLGISTGFRQLDLVTLGLRPTDLIYVGARPSMGKTSFMLNIIQHVAIELRIPTLLFSIEMPYEMMMMKLAASVAEVDFRKIQTGRMSALEAGKLRAASRKIQEAPLFINDEGTMTPGRIKLVAQQSMIKHGCQLGLIAVDYLQLMMPDKVIGKGDNTNLNVSDISRKLKLLAKDMNLPVLCLSQLSRGVEMRADKRPMLSDLRDSGSIEQDGDLICFIYRDEYYNPEKTEKPGIAEILIAKQRNGATGMIELGWDPLRTKFRNQFEPAKKKFEQDLPPL